MKRSGPRHPDRGPGLGFVILAAILVSCLVQRIVYRPLGDLKEGSERLAEGDLEHPIPVRSDDELGKLAESFNSMTSRLRKSTGGTAGLGADARAESRRGDPRSANCPGRGGTK